MVSLFLNRKRALKFNKQNYLMVVVVREFIDLSIKYRFVSARPGIESQLVDCLPIGCGSSMGKCSPSSHVNYQFTGVDSSNKKYFVFILVFYLIIHF